MEETSFGCMTRMIFLNWEAASSLGMQQHTLHKHRPKDIKKKRKHISNLRGLMCINLLC
jgi:hypothetical protein